MSNQTQLHCTDCFWCMVRDNKRECHFNAPQIVSGSGSGWSDQSWPIVQPNDYCSEHEEKTD